MILKAFVGITAMAVSGLALADGGQNLFLVLHVEHGQEFAAGKIFLDKDLLGALEKSPLRCEATLTSGVSMVAQMTSDWSIIPFSYRIDVEVTTPFSDGSVVRAHQYARTYNDISINQESGKNASHVTFSVENAVLGGFIGKLDKVTDVRWNQAGAAYEFVCDQKR